MFKIKDLTKNSIYFQALSVRQIPVLVQFAWIHRWRDERLPEGTRSGVAGTLDADTASGPVFQTAPLPTNIKH